MRCMFLPLWPDVCRLGADFLVLFFPVVIDYLFGSGLAGAEVGVVVAAA